MSNHTKLTGEKRAEFLDVLANTANVTRAAEQIGMARTYMYEIRAADSAFEKSWDAAVVLGTFALEDEATRRASEGWDEPVFYQGERTGLIRRFSDTLLIFLLKARDPKKYRERVDLTHANPDGSPLVVQVVNYANPTAAPIPSTQLSTPILRSDGQGSEAGGVGVESPRGEGSLGP